MNGSRGKHFRHRVGAVSFLNSRPLVYGLQERPDIDVVFDLPSRLPALLDDGCVDVALTPVIDMLHPGRSWKIVSDACIGCDGETMTVRVFSRTPPDQVKRIWVDKASHTSVALARLIWQETYGRPLDVCPLADPARTEDCDAVLLIGDKVVTAAPYGFTYQTDLGGAWKSLTGLPFVFAVWAAHARTPMGALPTLLSQARDRGVEHAEAIAVSDGPGLGWPPAVARTYLTRNLSYTLDVRHRDGMQAFLRMASQRNIAPSYRELVFT